MFSTLSLGAILGILAGGLQVFAYVVYGKKIFIGRIRPNTASWSIWAFGAVLESSSYVGVTGDWAKNILPIACAASALILFLLCIKFGRFGRISRFEWTLVALDCFAIFIWWWFQSAFFANALLVFTAVVSFVPIFLHVWKNPTTEDALPWFLWSSAYLLLSLAVVFRWEKWEDMVYPGVFLALHIIVALLALDFRVHTGMSLKNGKPVLE